MCRAVMKMGHLTKPIYYRVVRSAEALWHEAELGELP
jgi:hypothetical protein